MSATGKTGNKGISLRLIHLVMIVLAVVICALLFYSTYRSSAVFSTLSQATGNYIVRQKAAHDLMEASDYLTENVQRFTLEGDTTYLDNYFEEAFVSKRRETSITAMAENEAEQSVVSQLQDAMNESTTLMYREYYAMKLVISAKEIRNYPETLRAIELKPEDELLSPEEKMDKAQRMVMDSEYYNSKGVIRTKLKSGLDIMDKTMAATRQETSAKLNEELSFIRIVVIVMMAVILFMIGMTAWLATVPLLKAEKSRKEDKHIPVTGAKEIRNMAEAYNEMYDKLHAGEE